MCAWVSRECFMLSIKNKAKQVTNNAVGMLLCEAGLYKYIIAATAMIQSRITALFRYCCRIKLLSSMDLLRLKKAKRV